MNATDLTFNLGNLFTIIGGIIAIVTILIRFNGKVSAIEQKNEQNEQNIISNHRECVLMKDDYNKLIDKSNDVLHERVDRLKEDVKENRVKAETSVAELKSAMQEMELRIIKAIHELK